jgi:hypothetical protein
MTYDFPNSAPEFETFHFFLEISGGFGLFDLEAEILSHGITTVFI